MRISEAAFFPPQTPTMKISRCGFLAVAVALAWTLFPARLRADCSRYRTSHRRGRAGQRRARDHFPIRGKRERFRFPDRLLSVDFSRRDLFRSAESGEDLSSRRRLHRTSHRDRRRRQSFHDQRARRGRRGRGQRRSVGRAVVKRGDPGRSGRRRQRLDRWFHHLRPGNTRLLRAIGPSLPKLA